MSDHIVEVSDSTFRSEVEEAGRPVVVDFWAPWCTPCRVMEPILDELASQHRDRVAFVKLNVDENQETTGRLQVLSIPTLMVFEGGVVKKKLIGAVPRRRLEDELSGWLTPA
ncbi:MAG TPA: thioredoxin [Gaiellales bacterium]|nr:thioredoxin [Gaiellales bacterium]